MAFTALGWGAAAVQAWEVGRARVVAGGRPGTMCPGLCTPMDSASPHASLAGFTSRRWVGLHELTECDWNVCFVVYDHVTARSMVS